MQRGATPEVTFEEVAVHFSREEWEQLAPWQRALHRQVMCDNYDMVASLDPNSKFPHMKEESHGVAPCAGEHSGDSDSSDTTDSSGAWSGSDSKDGTGGRWQSGSGGPRSGCRDTARGRRARALSRPVPAASGLVSGGSGGAEAPPGRPYVCGTCGKSFRHRRSLLAHKKLRRGNRARHGCAECGRSFCLRGDLLRHRGSHRAPRCPDTAPGPDGERPFVCGPCGKSFSWRESPELHLQQHRALPCPECGRVFLHGGHLSLHRRGHSGLRPFPCARCGRAFATQASLSSHRRTRRQCRARGDGNKGRDKGGDTRGDGDRGGRRDKDTRGDGDRDSNRDSHRDRDPHGDGDRDRDT
uniref:Uncharacterized protein n=1 Tax=Junco hyemalis TaxID=40217 RepID=A0A8C5IZD8_JUNHY